MSYNITLEAGQTKVLKTAKKFCEEDIIVNVVLPEPPPLPHPSDEYQRVEWIKSDGKAYILTDIIANNLTGFEITASYTKQADSITCGSRATSGNTRFFAPYLLSSSSLYYGFNTGTSLSYSNKTNTKYISTINFFNSRCATFRTTQSNAGTVGSLAGRTLSQQTSAIGIFTFTQTSNSNIGTVHNYTLYSFRISQNNELVRNYVPCYRKSDGVIGLYDLITNQFLTNLGNGEFTKGENIEWEV